MHVYQASVHEHRPYYSFLGLYRKYSKADLLELIELSKGRKENDQINISTFYASFYGNSGIEIVYNNFPCLNLIADKLESPEFAR